MNRNSFKEDIERANKNMKRCSASLQADSLPSVPAGNPNNTGVVAYPFFRGSS